MTDKTKKRLKEVGTGCLILLITLMSYKFLAWNHWKARQGITVAKAIIKAPAAVNLTLFYKKKILLKKSFPYNRKGNFYIIDGFNIPPNAKNQMKLAVNGEPLSHFTLHCFPGYRILRAGDWWFAFTAENREIETLVELNRTLPTIIKTLHHSRQDL